MFRRSFLAASLGSLGLRAGTFDRTKPPATPPIPDFKLPATFETKLPNGLTVVLLEDRRLPLVTLRLGFLAGSKYDPAEIPGLSETVAALLTEGTSTLPSRQIAEELASIGGALKGLSGADGITLTGNCLSEFTPKLLALASDVTRNPSFPQEEVTLRIQNRKQELEEQRSQPAFLANEKLAQLVFGSNSYSHIAPTMESLDRMDRKALAGFQTGYLSPNNAFLVLLGRIPSREETLKLITGHFGSWQRKDLPPAPRNALPESRRVLALVDRPGSVQADIHVGRLAINRAHPDFFPLMVAQFILGGGGSSRMFLNIREKQGYAYDAHASLDARRDTGVLSAVTQVRNEVIQPALEAVVAEMSGMFQGTVPDQELTRARNFISGIFLLHLETQDGLASQLITLKLMGLPNSYLEQYNARVRAVTAQQIQEVARKYMAPDQAAVVVVGDASKIAKPLEKFGSFTVTKAL